MDYDGFILLIDRDFGKFSEWEKNSKNMSIEQLRQNYNDWRQKMLDAKEKYGFSNNVEGNENISDFMVKTVYFYYLAMIGWSTLRAYTDKLQDENKKLKKLSKTSSKISKKKKKSLSTVPKT